jgi:hypothetical protein
LNRTQTSYLHTKREGRYEVRPGNHRFAVCHAGRQGNISTCHEPCQSGRQPSRHADTHERLAT